VSLYFHLFYTWFVINVSKVLLQKVFLRTLRLDYNWNFIHISNFLLPANDALQYSTPTAQPTIPITFTLFREKPWWRCTERPYLTIKIKISLSGSELKWSAVQLSARYSNNKKSLSKCCYYTFPKLLGVAKNLSYLSKLKTKF